MKLDFSNLGRFDPKHVQGSLPKLFIGVGGTGAKMIKRIHDRLEKDPLWKKYKEPCTGFMVIDTNYKDLEAFPPNGKIKAIHTAQEGRAERVQRCINNEDRFLDYWRPEGYAPRNSALGAGQIRIESRMGFYVFSQLIANEIDQLIATISQDENPYLAQDNQVVEVFLFATLAGGTGSGCFLPMAYLLRERIESSGRKPRLQGYLMTSHALENRVKQEIHEQIHANTYAALKELEHLNQVSYGYDPIPFHYRMPAYDGEEPLVAGVPPFDWTAIIDEPKGMSLDLQETWEAVADAAYLNLITPAQASEDGERDNYTRFMRKMVNPVVDKGLQLDQGYTKHFGTVGASALICPSETLLEYCQERFVAHALETQLCLSLENDDGEGFNFSDPKFARLGDAGKRKLINRQWLKAAQKMAEEDKADQAEMIEWLKGQGLEEDAEEFAAEAGFWYQIVSAVDGGLSSDRSVAEVEESAGDIWAAAEKKEVVREVISLRQQVEKKLQQSVEGRVPVLSMTKLAAHNVGAATAHLQDLVSQFENSKSDYRSRVDSLAGKAKNGEVMETLREEADGFDAMRERYLVLQLVNRDIDGWITSLKTEIEQLEATSFWSETLTDKARSDVKEIVTQVSAMEGGNFLSGMWDKLSGGEEKKIGQKQIFTNQINDKLASIVAQTNKVTVLKARLEQLEAFELFLKERANSYAAISIVALDYAADANKRAEKVLGKELSVDDFTLRMEALLPFDGAGRQSRMWPQVWQDYVLPRIGDALNNAKFLGATISEAIGREEKRASREGEDVSSHRIVQEIEGAFTKKGNEALGVFILGDPQDENKNGITLPDMLELEAIYTYIRKLDGDEDERAGQRQKIVDRVLKVLRDPDSPEHDNCKEIVVSYLKGKMLELKRLSQPLAQINFAKVDGELPYSMTPILIASEGVLDQVGGTYGECLEVLTQGGRHAGNRSFNVENEVGKQVWDDPRIMVLYQGIAVIPIYAFPRVMELHGYYERVMNDSNRKANDLHISRRWETALPDLLPAKRRQNMAAREAEADRRFLIELFDTRIIYFSQGEWVLEGPEQDGVNSKWSLGEDPSMMLRAIPNTFKKVPGLEELVRGMVAERDRLPSRVSKVKKSFEKYIAAETVAGRGDGAHLEPLKLLLVEITATTEPEYEPRAGEQDNYSQFIAGREKSQKDT